MTYQEISARSFEIFNVDGLELREYKGKMKKKTNLGFSQVCNGVELIQINIFFVS